METSGPYRETLALFGHNHHPRSRRWPLLGLLQPATRAKQAQHTATCSRKRPAALVASCPSKAIVPSARGDPHRSNLCQNVLMRASFFFFVQGLVTMSVLPLPSQQPSDGLFSPMEVRTNHLPMCTDPLVPVRRAWSCTSKTTPSMGSSVLDIIAM
jgi:hypothetical protein